MTALSEKEILVLRLLEHVREEPFDPVRCAKHFYVQKLDERIHRFNDEKLNRIVDEVSGMDAGDEFFFSQEEVISMLVDYLEAVKAESS